MTPQELKNSILQLAIQGKLVAQRPEEGTGTELFQQIQEEKKRLIKEGVIKKGKKLPEIAEEEIPFEVPESWKWVRVGNIGSWSAGATPPRTNNEYYDGNIPWLKTGDLNDNYISEIPESISEMALEKTSVRLNPIGAVLMAMYGATIGKLGILSIEATTNQACCACIPYTGIDNKYLFYYLMANRDRFIKMGAGGAQPNISKNKIVSYLYALPPLAEQKRIVAKIEELQPLIDRYEKAWTKLEDFNQRFPTDMQKSLLQLAIQGKLVAQRPEEGTGSELYQQIQEEKKRLIKDGTLKKGKKLPEITEGEMPFDIPKTWMWCSIGNACINIQYGTAKKSSIFGKMPVLRMGNIQNGLINYEKLVYSSDDEDIEKFKLNCNDLLFNRTNSKELVGKTAIYKAEFPAIFAGYLIRITPLLLNSPYLNYVMQSQYYWQYCQTVRSDAIGQSNINAEKLKHFIFPLPPLAEQHRIVAKLDQLLPLCEKLK